MTKLPGVGAMAAAAVLVPAFAFAHHPGGAGNSGGAGPANTIPATTLEAGHVSAFIAYEFIRLRGLDNHDLILAASRHEHAHTIKTISSTSLGGALGITDDLTVSARLPYVTRSDIREGHHAHGAGGVAQNTVDYRGDAVGFGDLSVLSQWRFLKNRASGTEAALLVGVKLPTGQTGLRDRFGALFEAEFQPGSGSVDAMLGMAVTQRFGAWSLDANVLYTFARQGTQHTSLGNRFQYNGAVSVRLLGSKEESRAIFSGVPAAYAHLGHTHGPSEAEPHEHGLGERVHASATMVRPPPALALDAVLELNGERHEHQRVQGERDRNSGGNTVYLSPGLRASYANMSAFVSVGMPVVNHVGGLQSKPGHRVLSGIGLTF